MHVIAPGPFGGAESVVQALAEARSGGRLGETVVAALLNSSDDRFVGALRSRGLTVERIVVGPRRYLSQVRMLDTHIRRLHIDVVHTHIYHADFVGYAAARRARRPVVATYHGHVNGTLRNRLYEWCDRRLLARFDAVVCVSERNRQRLLAAGALRARLHVVPNGLVPTEAVPRTVARQQLGLPPDALAIGWVGRLSHEKGPDLLLDALQGVAHANRRTVIIGDGPERSALERRARLGRSGIVTFTGVLADVPRFLSAFDLLVISSRTEGLPMVLLEAVGAGVPVVAFAVGGIPDQLTEECAWLVPPGDVPALARAVSSALDSGSERLARSRAARHLVDARLSLDDWIARVEEVYATVGAPSATATGS